MSRVAGYDAFISYSYSQDKILGPRLQSGLQRFAKPWYRLRALRVFCDTANLAASPGLWASIEEALSASRWFVLLASADAAQSYWVNREVEWWLKHRSSDQLLIVATSPNLAWDKRKQDWADDAPVPPALRGAFTSEPLWVNLSDMDLDTRRAVPREHLAALAAPLRGIPMDTLIGDHLREHRRARRLARGAVTLLGALVVVAALATAVAIRQGHTAVTQSDNAISARDAALAGQLAAQSGSSLASTNPALAKLESVAAARIATSRASAAQALDAMLNAALLPGIASFDGKDGPVNSVAFSPNGKTLASGAEDGTVRLWDLGTGLQLGGPLNGKDGPVNSVAFSPNGKTLASGAADGAVLWGLGTSQRPGSPLNRNGTVSSVAFSPDGKTLAIGTAIITFNDASESSPAQLWNVATRQQISNLNTSSNYGDSVGSVAFSPNGKTLALGGVHGGLPGAAAWLWNTATGHLIGAPLTTGGIVISSVAFSPDGKTLAAGGDDSNGKAVVWLWNTATGHQIGAPLTTGGNMITSVAFSPDGKTLATGGNDGTARLWNVATRQQVSNPLTNSGGSVTSVAFSPDGNILATGDEDGTAQLWDVSVAVNTLMGTPVPGVSSRTGSVAFSPDGKTIATGDDSDGTVRIRDIATGKQTGNPLTSDGAPARSIAFSPDGKTLATSAGFVDAAGGNISQPARLWDAATGRQIATIPSDWSASIFTTADSVAFSPDGKTLAVGGDSARGLGALWLWNTATLRQIGSVRTPAILNGGVTSVAFSPDGKTLAAGGINGGFNAGSSESEGAIWIWSLASSPKAGNSLRIGGGPVTSVAFSPDGKTLATGGDDGTARLWNVATLQQVSNPLTSGGGPVTSLAFSPDGKTLAVGGTDDNDGDGTVQLWDVATSEQIGDVLNPGSGAVSSMAFSPAGKTLAAADGNGPARLWDVAYLQDTASYLCASAAQFVTRDEWAENVQGIPYQAVCP